jgi:hypothetical protein
MENMKTHQTPTCPKCHKIFATGTKFCDEDGAKLISCPLDETI